MTRLVVGVALVIISATANAQDAAELQRIIDTALDQFQGFGQIAFETLRPYALGLAFTLITIDFVWTHKDSVFSGDMPAIGNALLSSFVGYGLILFAVTFAYEIFTAVIDTYEFLGAAIVGGSNPVNLAFDVIDILFNLLIALFSDLGALGMLTNIGPAIAVLVITVAQAALAAGVATFQIAFSSLRAYRTIGWLAAGYLINLGLRLLFIFIILSVAKEALLSQYTPVIALIRADQYNGLIARIIILLIIAYIVEALSNQVKEMADSLALGRPIVSEAGLRSDLRQLSGSMQQMGVSIGKLAAAVGGIAGASAASGVRQAAGRLFNGSSGSSGGTSSGGAGQTPFSAFSQTPSGTGGENTIKPSGSGGKQHG